MNKEHAEISKYLSYVLRHRPDAIGISLDPGGWVAVDALLTACAAAGRKISEDQLTTVIEKNDKKRFEIRDGMIRASQGHSVDVDMMFEAIEPPAKLFHGTATQFIGSINQRGLESGGRLFVHLSEDADTAIAVGKRHGEPVVIEVDSSAMHTDGFSFHRAANGVWLTHEVPAAYIRLWPKS